MLSSEANEICAKDSKKTITAEHVLKALENLGLPEYEEDARKTLEELKVWLMIFNMPCPD